MAAEFDTQPDYATEDDQPTQHADHRTRGDGGWWAALAFITLAAIVLFVLLGQATARVPETVGLSRVNAEAALIKAGLAVGDVSEVPLGSGKPGFVQDQAPLAGATVRRGATVDLMIALGGNLAVVPDVVGQDSANASVKLLQAGFKIDSAEEYSDSVPTGAAVSQSPAAGSRAASGSTVTVYYSLGSLSAAGAAVAASGSDGGASSPGSGTTSSGADRLMMNATRAYPGASTWSSDGDVYVRLSPGGGARRVTRGGDWDSSPVLSPSRKYLVFLRAPSSGRRSTAVGAVSLTALDTHMLSMPESTLKSGQKHWYGKPVFAPSENSTRPDSDWIVLPQYWDEDAGEGSAASARLLVCNVPMSSSWVSWNLQFRPALTLSLGKSGRAGCVRVQQKDGSKTIYSRDFNATTGLYLR